MSFSAILPPDALRAFGYGLDALVKFGDELHIEAKKDQLILWTVNTSITGQAVILLSPKLFDKYTIRPLTNSHSASCRVLLKTLRKIFRNNKHSSSNIKQCELKLIGGSRDGSIGSELRLHLRFGYENGKYNPMYIFDIDYNNSLLGMTKTNSLWYGDIQSTRPLSSTNMPYSFSIDAELLHDHLSLMDSRIQDISFIFTRDHVIAKAYLESFVGRDTSKPMQSQFKISSHDFVSYNVDNPVTLIINLKDLKTVVNYGIDTGDILHGTFEGSGKPLVFIVKQQDLVYANFTIMTQLGDEDVESANVSMSNISVNTGDSELSISRQSLSRHDQRIRSSSTESSSSRQEERVVQPSASLEMMPPSFGKQKTARTRDSTNNSDDQLFPFRSPSLGPNNVTRSTPPQQRHEQTKQDDGSTTDDDNEELFPPAIDHPKRKRFFSST
ncbi:Rad9-domain-containing protein [Halteromyces radiatus]|uniref:Rad9-domain-containing protein n=1 Tax=Halteromyces radiatus TaxID=101107 RepID=UPI0022212A3D|nr:Rad9-domain-containing protein [Halteromyces radiatus]KAI8076826.1 Rad9-domain-containing protein [Halteromyces radiatus]